MASLLARAAFAIGAAQAVFGCAAAAIGFLVGALYLYLRSLLLAPSLAALIVGLVLLALAGSAVALMAWMASGRRALMLRRTGANDATLAELRNRAMREVAAAADAHPYRISSLAFLFGLALGANREMQDILRSAIKAGAARDGGR